jgi:hypothetical protein
MTLSNWADGVTFRAISFGSGGEDCEICWIEEFSILFDSEIISKVLVILIDLKLCLILLKILIFPSMAFAIVFIWGIS